MHTNSESLLGLESPPEKYRYTVWNIIIWVLNTVGPLTVLFIKLANNNLFTLVFASEIEFLKCQWNRRPHYFRLNPYTDWRPGIVWNAVTIVTYPRLLYCDKSPVFFGWKYSYVYVHFCNAESFLISSNVDCSMYAFKSFITQKKFVCWKNYTMRNTTCDFIYRQYKVDCFLLKTDLHLKRFYGFDVVITSRTFRLTFDRVGGNHRQNKLYGLKKGWLVKRFFFTKSWFIPETFVRFRLRLWLNRLNWWRSSYPIVDRVKNNG